MGCGSSHPNDKVPQQKARIENANDLKLSCQDLVSENQNKITQDYQMLNPPLGKGAFGEVRKAIHKSSNQYRAIKIICKDKQSPEEFQRLKIEVEILKSLDHPNIIKVYEFYQDPRFVYIVTELCTGGELFDKIVEEKSFDERKAALTIKQVLQAINYCHKNNIVHRDLKPENILYESRTANAPLKIVDFGTSKFYDPNEKMSQKLGTPYYIAPEVLNKQYNEKCDLWSIGVIVYIMLCGYPPFQGVKDRDIMEKVQAGVFSFESQEWENVSLQAKDFITQLLEKDVSKRLSAEQALNHPWIVKFSKQEINLPILNSCLKNMQNLRVQQKLSEAALMFMVNFFATKEEKNELIQQFKALDLNHDGVLSKEELIIGYSKVMGTAQAQEEVDKIMSVVDKDGNGYIDYSEFVLATINKEQLLQKEKLESAFRMFDKDGSGSITYDEIRQIFGRNKNIEDNVWRDMIKEVDINGDGEISYVEFKEMMMKIISPQ